MARDSVISEERKSLSNSEFAGEQTDDGTPITDLWLLDRFALSIRMTRHQNFPDHGVLKTYQEYTKFHSLPATKEDKPDFLAPKPNFALFVEKLCEGRSDIPTLDKEVWKHVAPHLWSIHRLSASARDKLNRISSHKVLESDSRIEWNVLLSLLLRFQEDTGDQWSITSRNERSVKLSGSKLADSIDYPIINDSEIWGDVQDLFIAYAKLCNLERRDIVGRENDIAHSNAVNEALNHKFKSYYQTPGRKKFLDSAYLSPSSATVDNLGMLSVPVQFLPDSTRSIFNNLTGFFHTQEEDKNPPDMGQNLVLLIQAKGLDGGKAPQKESENRAVKNTEYLSPPSHSSSKVKEEPSKAPRFPHPHHLVRDPNPHTDFFAFEKTEDELVEQKAHFPFVIHEFKRPSPLDSDIVNKNMNQLRMSLVSAVIYLEHFGITGFPLFGVSVNGYMAVIISAWSGKLAQENCIFLGDRDTVQYNLVDPISAYNYCTFIAKLILHGRNLHERLQQLGNHPQPNQHNTPRIIKWTVEEQRNGLKAKKFVPPPPQLKSKMTEKDEGEQEPSPQNRKFAHGVQPTSVPSFHVTTHEQAGAEANPIFIHPMTTRSRGDTQAGGQHQKPEERKQLKPTPRK